MKIGIFALLSEMTLDPVSVARRCEELGFESIWVPEHAIIPVHTKVPYPALDGKIPDVYTRFPDPFVLLGMMASVTRTLKLGTAICLVPERHPLALAKEVATLDYYSGGRFLFGIGAGWQAEESEIMGVDFPRRWPITREYVRAMKELWTKPEASFEGRFLKFPAGHLESEAGAQAASADLHRRRRAQLETRARDPRHGRDRRRMDAGDIASEGLWLAIFG